MPNNRRRGRDGELEWAKYIGGDRISRLGEAGSDVLDRNGGTWEVKRIKKWPARIYQFILQAATQGDLGVAIRANYGKWYVLIDADKFKEIYYDDGTDSGEADQQTVEREGDDGDAD